MSDRVCVRNFTCHERKMSPNKTGLGEEKVAKQIVT